MKVMVFGASGIIGQHMRLCVPQGIEPVWCRHQADLYHKGVNMIDVLALGDFLDRHKPDVIVNLAGHNDVDAVQREPYSNITLNCLVPGRLADWCDIHGAHLLHVSTQGVFGGGNAPYSARNKFWQERATNEYGMQKRVGEGQVRVYRNWTIARPTFVVGVRPLPAQGRENPAEAIFSGRQQRQVNDRFFSIAFAGDVARQLWCLTQQGPQRRVFHIGMPGPVSRYALAYRLGCANIEAVSHDSFPGLAPRPFDTSWAEDALRDTEQEAAGLEQIKMQWQDREVGGVIQRARELAIFFGITEVEALAKLSQGFHVLHKEVAEDFRRANPQTDEELLDWYEETESYCWELSAYHCDDLKGLRFNYSGMVDGIATHLTKTNKRTVLCLGDGIGDLTLACAKAGLNPLYHDLRDSRTATFARFRFWAYGYENMPCTLTSSFIPKTYPAIHDAVVSLDFLEHVPNVEEWTRAIYGALVPGGLFLAQNAFAIGDNEHGGSIPCHLSSNNHYEQDWIPLLQQIGFEDASGGWWRKP